MGGPLFFKSLSGDQELVLVFAFQPGRGATAACPGLSGRWIAILGGNLATGTLVLFFRATRTKNIRLGQIELSDQALNGIDGFPGFGFSGFRDLLVECFSLGEKILKFIHGLG